MRECHFFRLKIVNNKNLKRGVRDPTLQVCQIVLPHKVFVPIEVPGLIIKKYVSVDINKYIKIKL